MAAPAAMTGLYDILGVQREATPEQLRLAYKARALRTHPDHDGGTKEAFIAVWEAYHVLREPETRKRYDITGHAPDPSQGDQMGKAETDFQDLWGEGRDSVKSSVEDLLEWWMIPSTKDQLPHQYLQTDGDDFYRNLTALFRVYRIVSIAAAGAMVENRNEVKKGTLTRPAMIL
jgi:DnaJ-class molecular chaperone